MADRLDIILFGASGFTGKYCIGEIHRLTKSTKRLLTWGISGRSEQKLIAALSEYQKQIGEDLSFVPIIKADVGDFESMTKMTARARIIINCCGPYRFYGEPVVKACLETGTHHVDVTGEPQYMETMQLKYHKIAQEKGVYIVSSCGFDSIPADLGVVFLQKNFKGTLNSVETYIQQHEEARLSPGPSLNYATWESAIHGIAHAKELNSIRRKLNSRRLPNFKPKLQPRPPIHKSEVINAWGVPFMGCDRSVIKRTQRHLYEQDNLRPVQIQTYQGVESFNSVIMMGLFYFIFTFLIKFQYGRELLLKHPKLFTGGFFSHESPSEQKLQKLKLSITFYGKGWDEKSSEIANECEKLPNKAVVGYVTGYNSLYVITATAVTLAAIVILTETNKLPERGGVYSPGAAFAKTSLIQQLQQNGLIFKIKSKL